MKREEALKLTETALEKLSRALEQGHSDALTRYLQVLSRFHRYSFGNVMLIAHQRPDATHVAGYQTWRKLKRYVRKGEKGIGILAPLVYKSKQDEGAAIDAQQLHDSPLVLRGFKIVHVFDVSQTDGEALPEFAGITGSPGERIDTLRQAIGQHDIELHYDVIPGGALGVSQKGSITIRPDLPPAEEFSVLVHEFAHELLHQSERRSETTKTIRETEAEAVAFVVSQAMGLETTTRSSDYIQLYRGNKDTLLHSLEHIQHTAARIIEALQPVA